MTVDIMNFGGISLLRFDPDAPRTPSESPLSQDFYKQVAINPYGYGSDRLDYALMYPEHLPDFLSRIEERAHIVFPYLRSMIKDLEALKYIPRSLTDNDPAYAQMVQERPKKMAYRAIRFIEAAPTTFFGANPQATLEILQILRENLGDDAIKKSADRLRAWAEFTEGSWPGNEQSAMIRKFLNQKPAETAPAPAL